MKCQICNQEGIEDFYDFCNNCNWRYDDTLELYFKEYLDALEAQSNIPESELHPYPELGYYVVSFLIDDDLTEEQSKAWSTVNKCTPEEFKLKWLSNK